MTPEPHLLTNAWWKTERAKAHIEELKTALNEFAQSDPFSISSQEEPERDAIRYRVQVVQQPHVYTFLIAGDALQCLRTALDQAVWSLASLKYPDPDWTQFPVFAEPLNTKSRKRFDEQTHGIPGKAKEFIQSLQPYNRPAGMPLAKHLLWQLHELNRIDKHRRISVRTMFTFISTTAFGCAPPAADFLFEVEDTADGRDLISFGRYKNLKPKLTPVVLFGELNSGITITVDAIEEIYQFVTRHVLPHLAGSVL